MIVEFRRRTLLPLDDVLGYPRDSIPNSPSPACTGVSIVTASPVCPKTLIKHANEAARPHRYPLRPH